jgi:hypothetical protein
MTHLKSKPPVSYKLFQTHKNTIAVTQSDKLTKNFNKRHKNTEILSVKVTSVTVDIYVEISIHI